MEDEAITAMDVKNRLNRFGFDVVGIASRGDEAVQKAGDLKPNLILMDIVLKGDMDGIEAASKIKTLFDIPVVYMSAFSDENTFERVKSSSPYGFVNKPVSSELLVVSIEAAIYKHSLDKKLIDSEERLRSIFDSSKDFIYSYDLEGRFTSANKHLCEFSNLNENQIIGKTGLELGLHEENSKKWDKIREQVLKTDSTYKSVISMSLSDSKKYVYEVILNPIHDINGEINGISGVSRDLTEQKKAEEKLKEKAIMLANVNDAVIGTDANYLINYWNNGAEEIYGYSAEEIIGQYAGILEPEFFGMSLEEALEQLESTGELNIQLFHTTKDGRRIILDSRNRLLYDENGKQYGNIGINRDITELKKAEEALKDVCDNLELKVKERTTELEKSYFDLKESEEKYRSLFENLNSAAVLIEPILDENGKMVDFRYLIANSELKKHLGKTPNEVVGKLYSDFFPYLEKNPVFDIYEKVLFSGETFKGEIFLPAIKKHVDMSVYRPIKGQLAFILTDISDHKKAEETLKKPNNEL